MSRGAKAFGPTALATPANVVTMGRLLASPVLAIIVAEFRSGAWVWFALWCVLVGTDGLDGYVARWHGTTSSGAFLDPLADKFLVIGVLAALMSRGELSIWPVLLIAARELAMSLFRMSASRHEVSVPARPLAKAKTATQDIAVGLALLPVSFSGHSGVVNAVLWFAVGLTLVSGLEYAIDARRLLHSGNRSAALADRRSS